ncbi:asparagine synthase (glutamine-hydrolyzing) [Streptomyces scabiei]|uniref:asparagine synthase (glutamine-hydrolyzing) n=1 Tax=Streptomyces scabiei TaxID=1930 RepID=UPI0038F7C94A
MSGPVRFSGCGIAGVLHLTEPTSADSRPGAAAVQRMTQALAHRGPHGEGIWDSDGVILGHRRLAVTGLGEAGAQPMTRDHLTIVYNGEAYNAPALRAELSAHYRFTSHTDTEVVLRAWQHWGASALDKLRGMYAFAVFDARTRQLTLVRDRIGIKPLYYHHADGFLIFASEIEALLASGHVPRRPDLDTLTRQLLRSTTLSADPARTPVDQVLALPPATVMTLQPRAQPHTRTYWTLPHPHHSPVAGQHGRNGGRELGRLLDESVSGMLMGDVTVAAFLSGGLDSSAIATLAAQHAPLPCITTTYTTPPSPEADDDLRHSRLLAARFNGRILHHVVDQPVTPTLDDLDAIGDLAAIGDDPRHLAIWRNYRAVHDLGLRVVLNGQGADEIMGGYVGRPSTIRHLVDVQRPAYATARTLAASRQIPGLSRDALALRDRAHQEVLDLHASLPGDPVERAHRLLFTTQLTRVVQFEDFLGMRASVEARFPFLDHPLVEWAFTQPFATHIDASTRRGKVHLAAAMRPHLPPALLSRPKAVFPIPEMRTLQASLAALVTEHHAELHNDPLVSSLFAIPSDPGSVGPETLWPLLTLWRWHHKLRATARTPAPA